jgi:hypothetical protein
MLIALVIYFFFAMIVLFGGFTIKAIYKGYLASKGQHLGLIQDIDIDNIICTIAGFPFFLFVMILVLISEFPFWFGKLLGKMLK